MSKPQLRQMGVKNANVTLILTRYLSIYLFLETKSPVLHGLLKLKNLLVPGIHACVTHYAQPDLGSEGI